SALGVLEDGDHGAIRGARVARVAGPEAVGIGHREPEAGHEIDPVDPALEERAAAREVGLITPITRLLPLQRVDGDDPDVSDRALRDEATDAAKQRLVGVVLRDEKPAPRGGGGARRDVEVRGRQEWRLLHDDVLARGEGGARELKGGRGRRRDEDDCDARGYGRRLIVAEVTGAAEPAGVVRGPGGIAAREVAIDVRELPEGTAMQARREPAAEQSDSEAAHPAAATAEPTRNAFEA